MVRRPIEDDEDNPERWLVSYADFITLLFAFFVVMYSVSSVNHSKYMKVSSSINTAFNKNKAKNNQANDKEKNPTVPITETAPPLPSNPQEQVQQRDVESMAALGKMLSKILAPLIDAGNARIIQNSLGLRIDIKDGILFRSGSADVLEPARALLKDIAAPLTTKPYAIIVEGHTDDTPIYIQNAAFFSNWELSAVRASSVIKQLNEAGVENIRLSAVGYGPSQPVADNMTDVGREVNRHMTVMILYQHLMKDNGKGVEIFPDKN